MIIDALPTSLPEFVNYLQGQFFKNDFLQAAVVGAPVAALTYTFREIPNKIWRGIRFLLTVEMSFNSDSADFQQIASFISDNIVNQKFSRRARRLRQCYTPSIAGRRQGGRRGKLV